ncbi:bZIP transcription factor 50 [Camellia lanceoleosa]|uniref:BZIP transcription factor 50 n=1 Tax=Camellia lanceoleosa TaxID=1840588 RepID=A0ACC0HIH7_9ERIC|nr:bZIP transcription factor 50 [Camellia lanceoleosa]
MGESGTPENGIAVGQIDWEHMLDNIVPEDLNLFDPSLILSDMSDSPPDSLCLSIGEIEQMLMTENDNEVQFSNDFLSEFLLDSPLQSDHSAEVVDLHLNTSSSSSPEEHEVRHKVDDLPHNNIIIINNNNNNNNNGDANNDPVSKKRQRQLRNRDAAVRSRERKKMYVKDLEIKSRYLEGECRRLGRLLQCCFAENEALRLSLQNAKAFDASMTKQESAVLLLESLLLGSLLWFLGIVCLLILPSSLQLSLEAVSLENVDKKSQVSLAPRGPESKLLGLMVFQSFMVCKRCKASRSRMKPSLLILEV